MQASKIVPRVRDGLANMSRDGEQAFCTLTLLIRCPPGHSLEVPCRKRRMGPECKNLDHEEVERESPLVGGSEGRQTVAMSSP